MKFTVNQKSLLRELDLLQGVANRKTSIPILNCILFNATEGGLLLTATDAESSISTTCLYSSLIVIPGTVALPAKRLRDILNEFDNMDVDFELQEGYRVKITQGKSTFNFIGRDPVSFPEIGIVKKYSVSVPLKILLGQIERVVFAMPDKDQNKAPKAVQLNIDKNVLSMAAMDGFQFSAVCSNITFPDELSVLIPENSLKELVKLLSANSDKEQDGLVYLTKKGNKVHFKVGDREMSSGLLASPFPDLKMIPQDGQQLVTFSRDLFVRKLRRVVIMSNDKLPFIELNIQDGIVEISTETADVGDAKELMDMNSNGLSIKLGFNANYLLPCLNASKTEKMSMQIKNPSMPVVLRPVGDEDYDWRCMVMVRRDISAEPAK